ncbi:aldehyde dehydrogenase family protein [Nocardia sp. NBC_01388]|uniref:aldehyde dehydrogenase family protein n=1 Tax=Nocardia sp. NBC_01388 TaxID=2903596 RepID=UPI003252CF87
MTPDTLDVPKHVAELRAAQPDWEALGVRGRVRWVRRYADWLLDNADRITEILASEGGKPLVEAKIEFAVPVDIIKYYARNAEKYLRPNHPAPPNLLNRAKRVTVTHRPYPVVAVITPWNFPLGLSLMDSIPALLAGAAVVVKPAPATPGAVRAAVEGWAEIGAPPVFSVIAEGDDAGRALVEEADYIQFTGSTEVGRKIAQRCGERLIPYGLELGGKDPAIVLADADLDHAARGIAWGALANAGQMCTSVERVYVLDTVHDEFLAKLTAHVRGLRRDSDVGPLVTEDQFALVSGQLDDARAAGARVMVGGGTDPERRWIEPTVLAEVDSTMACVCAETFGPLIPVIRVSSEDEAVAAANATDYGLSASIWTSDRRHGAHLAARLEAGAVNINDAHANIFYFTAPMDGWKNSGMGGRLGGAAGILKYTRPQTVTKPRVSVSYQRHLLWYPYTRKRTELVGRLLRALAATGRRRLG